VVIPRFEALKKEGQAGQTKMTQYTRYLTIALAVLQSSTLITFAQNPASLFNNPACTNILSNDSVVTILIMVLTMTAGTGVVMWLGELITDKGIGNGMSLLIFTSIAAGFPASLWAIQQRSGWDVFIGIILIGLRRHLTRRLRRAESAPHPRAVRQADGRAARLRRHLDLHPAQGQHGRCHPVIFASSLMSLPMLLAQFNQRADGNNPGWVDWINANLVSGDKPIYMALYIGLILFFTFFYVSITFNPTEVADNMKKYGGFIPGIRAGRPTAEYLSTSLPGSRCRARSTSRSSRSSR
jgi:preprotein translocase subunit SecY